MTVRDQVSDMVRRIEKRVRDEVAVEYRLAVDCGVLINELQVLWAGRGSRDLVRFRSVEYVQVY